MGQGQDAAIDQAIRDYFRDALDCGQEFADIFAPDGEVDVDDCISTLEARLTEHRRRLVVKSYPSDIQPDAEALVGGYPPKTAYKPLSGATTRPCRPYAGKNRGRPLTDHKTEWRLCADGYRRPAFRSHGAAIGRNHPGSGDRTCTGRYANGSTGTTSGPTGESYEEVLTAQGIKAKTIGDLRLSFDLARAVIDFGKPASLLDINDMKALRDILRRILAHYQKKPETRDLDPNAAVEAGKHLPKMGFEIQKKRFDFSNGLSLGWLPRNIFRKRRVQTSNCW